MSLTFRKATMKDCDLIYQWANDPETRNNSYNKDIIPYQNHVNWFKQKIVSDTSSFYIFLDEHNKPVGQIRIEKTEGPNALLSISIAKEHRGRGYASMMLKDASVYYLNLYPGTTIHAHVFVSNEASSRSFIKAGYKKVGEEMLQQIPSIIYQFPHHH